MKKNLSNVTVVSIVDSSMTWMLDDLKFSFCSVLDNFDIFEALHFSQSDIGITGVKLISVPPVGSMKGYSRFCVNELHKYIRSDFYLIIQPDGFVVDPNKWTDEFLGHDYIGAPWPRCLAFSAMGYTVGNGGFSLRSRRLIEASKDLVYDENPLWDFGLNRPCMPEDYFFCIRHRRLLESRGVRFAPSALAARFSIEYNLGEAWRMEDSFGCHCGELEKDAKGRQIKRMQELYKKYSTNSN